MTKEKHLVGVVHFLPLGAFTKFEICRPCDEDQARGLLGGLSKKKHPGVYLSPYVL